MPRRRHDGDVRDRAVLVHVERHGHVAAQRHRRVRDEPVAPDLGEEPPHPGPELDALRVELDALRRTARRPAGCRRSARARSALTSRRAFDRPPPVPVPLLPDCACGFGPRQPADHRVVDLARLGGRGPRGRRAGLRRVGCRSPPGRSAGLRPLRRAGLVDALRRVAPGERQRVRRLRRPLVRRHDAAVAVGEFRVLGRPLRLELGPGLHEHEPPVARPRCSRIAAMRCSIALVSGDRAATMAGKEFRDQHDRQDAEQRAPRRDSRSPSRHEMAPSMRSKSVCRSSKLKYIRNLIDYNTRAGGGSGASGRAGQVSAGLASGAVQIDDAEGQRVGLDV